jgi:hypothetical protein
MIRKFLVLLLIESIALSTALAQTSDTAAPSFPAAISDSSGEKMIKIVRRENKLRRGKDAEFAVVLGTSSADCGECLPALLQEGDRPMFQSLKLNRREGFSVRYANDSARKFESLPMGEPVYTQKGPAVLLKLHADKKLKAGDYTLTGKARLMIIHRGQVNGEKEVDVVIPIRVVDKNEAVSQNNFAYQYPEQHHVRDAFVGLIMVPLYLPLILVWIVVCSVGHDCSEY